jgi:hypothetical protein
MGWKALKNAFSGYNVSIFAYGQTGSGKSHSMIGTSTDPGLIRRIGEFLFDFMARGEEELGFKYRTTVSAAEIYCENVRDLLASMNGPGGGGAGGGNGGNNNNNNKKKQVPKRTISVTQRAAAMLGGSNASKAQRMAQEGQSSQRDMVADIQGKESLKIREGKDGVYVEGQSKVEIRSNAEMAGIIFAAIENRMVGYERVSCSLFLFLLFLLLSLSLSRSFSSHIFLGTLNLIHLYHHHSSFSSSSSSFTPFIGAGDQHERRFQPFPPHLHH